MTKIPNADLSKVTIRCKKKKCNTKDFILHRHHKGHQYLFVALFVWRLEEPRYRRFVKRYYEYNPEDVVHVCSCHHREVHELYDFTIQEHVDRNKRRLVDFTWKQAEALMAALVALCNDWLGQKTKGSKVPWPSNGQTKRNSVNFLEVLEYYSDPDPVPF